MSGTLRERRRNETRAELLVAALDLFERNGFEQTTVEDIAAAVGISARTFFRYFDSKTDVVLHSTHHDDPKPKQDLVAAVIGRPASESPGQAMAAVLRTKLAAALESDECTLRQLRIAVADPALHALAQSSFHDHRPELAEAFAARLGTSPDDLQPRVLAAAFTEIIWVILERWTATGGDPTRLSGMIDEAFASLEHTL